VSAREREIEAIRAEIDAVDRELLRLLNERARLAERVARAKIRAGEGDDIYRPDREAAVRRALVEANPGPLPDEDIERLFGEVLSACRALQRPISVAFLGPRGTFTEAAALKHFGHAVESRALESIDAVFREVEASEVDFGIVPVENSTEGVVNHTLDRFMGSALAICGEVELRIHHLLMAAEAVPLAELARVYSHQQSLAQCRRWLDRNLPAAERLAVASNAEAARRAVREAGAAAIAGPVAAETYGLEVLARNIEDEPDNTTRFLVIGRHPARPSGFDKTSLLLSARNRPGALFHLLETFARHGISMTRIESRPARSGLWEYVFFIDVEGHAGEEPLRSALAELEREAAMCRVLGSYPRCAR